MHKGVADRGLIEAATVRARVSWLVAGRVIISTALLGSATLLQFTVPGTFPVNPFFLLIGLTYGLSVVYLVTLNYLERYPLLIDVQLWLDAVLVSAFILLTGGIRSDFSSLYLLPIIAASTIRGRRGALQVAGLSACGYFAIVASQYVSLETLPAVDGARGRSARRQVRAVRGGDQRLRLHGRGPPGGLGGRTAPLDRSAARGRLRGHGGPEGLQRARHRQPRERPGDRRRPVARVVVQPRRDRHHRRGAPNRALGRDARSVLALPPAFRERAGPGRRFAGAGAPTFRMRPPTGGPSTLGSPRRRCHFPDGRAGHLFTFQDVTDVKRLERDAGRRDRLAAVGEMAAGIAHEIRNPLASMSGSMQVLRSELAAQRRSGRADGHRPARSRSG